MVFGLGSRARWWCVGFRSAWEDITELVMRVDMKKSEGL